MTYNSLRFNLAKWYRALLFNLSSSENRLFLWYYRHLFKPEPGTLDEFLDGYSRKRANVTFLQVGANDGFIQDPIHKFIKRDNWQGVLLEPQPDVFNERLVRIHRKRKGIKAINAALDLEDGSRAIYRLAISNERWATGASSFNRELLIKRVREGHMRKHIRRQRIRLPDNLEEIITSEEISTISPATLLAEFREGEIDLLVIDTEGYDFEILKMLDLDRISPEVIIYEAMNLDPGTARQCQAYLEKHGYSCRTVKKDVLAVKEKQDG